MAHHKELLDITRAISGSFNSRNNDLNGYWALGVLYKLTNDIHITQLKLDLLQCETIPHLIAAQPTITQYNVILTRVLQAKHMNNQWVKQATMIIDFNQYNKTHHEKVKYPQGEPYISTCEILDDMGKTYQSIHYGKCLLHDPKRELKSLSTVT